MTQLLAHCGSTKMTRDQLVTILPPERTDTHKPIAHITLVESLLESLSFRHINVVKDEYAVSADGMKLFGVLDLETVGDGFRFSLGLRNANDKSMRLGMVVGVRIMVCDNLSFHGEFEPIMAKHTKHFDLNNALAIGIDQMQRGFKPMAQQIEHWRQAQLTDGQAKETIYRAFIQEELDAPKHLARVVHAEYFDPKYPGVRPPYRVQPPKCFHERFQATRPHSSIQSDGELRRVLRQLRCPMLDLSKETACPSCSLVTPLWTLTCIHCGHVRMTAVNYVGETINQFTLPFPRAA